MIQRLSPVVLALLLGCHGLPPGLQRELEPILNEGGDQEWHVGPEVELGKEGPARFVPILFDAFRLKRATQMVRFVDTYYRAPANVGYDAVIDRMVDELVQAGYAEDDPRLSFEVLETGMENSWTPVRAKLTLLVDGEKERVLHAFDTPEGADRVMLPVNAPSCRVEAEVALSLHDLRKGMIMVSAVPSGRVMRRAKGRGAAGLISASLYSFNFDQSGQDRHLDAIQFEVLDDENETLPIARISPRSHHIIEEAVERARKRGAKVRLRLEAEVEREQRPLRTLVATIRGKTLPDEAVAMVSHVQEPGACDNASGVAGLLESACNLAELLQEDGLPWPARSLVFIWGDEFRQTDIWLARTDMTPVAGISSDMTGQSKDTGAIALLERMPDPGAITTLPPDAHTPWGAGKVTEDELAPNGLAVIARCAMVDVGVIDGGWTSADHPWEGGSDHDIFIRRGIPAVLFWHFTDFTYHTSLDRMKYVDPKEIRRTGTALLATGLALADPKPADLERYVRSLEHERLTRIAAANAQGDQRLVELWETWCVGARHWLRRHCLGSDVPAPTTEAGGKK